CLPVNCHPRSIGHSPPSAEERHAYQRSATAWSASSRWPASPTVPTLRPRRNCCAAWPARIDPSQGEPPMQRHLILALAGAVSLALSACGGDTGPEVTQGGTVQTTPTDGSTGGATDGTGAGGAPGGDGAGSTTGMGGADTPAGMEGARNTNGS